MKIHEIIVESELDDGTIYKYTWDESKRILTKLGFELLRQGDGSHEIWWNPKTTERFLLAKDKKNASAISSDRLAKLLRKNNMPVREGDIDEAVGLPGDSSTLLSLLSEMANMLGAGGVKNDHGPLRSAIVQAFNNGSAEDDEKFEKQLNFRLGSIKSMWMGKNWPQLKSCFLRLKKNPKYQRTVKALDALGDWPVFLVKDPKNPSLSKYFSGVLSASPQILSDMARHEPEEHVRGRAKHLAGLISQRISQFNAFRQHWVDEYAKHNISDVPAAKPKDDLSGKQAAGAEDIIGKVLSAVPPKLAGEIRPQIARMGSQNEKLMFIMQALQKAGIDPHKVLG